MGIRLDSDYERKDNQNKKENQEKIESFLNGWGFIACGILFFVIVGMFSGGDSDGYKGYDSVTDYHEDMERIGEQYNQYNEVRNNIEDIYGN